MAHARSIAAVVVVFGLAGAAHGWVSTQHDREGAAGSVALFGNGDVATSVGYSDIPSDAGILRLNGATGTLVWRRELATPGDDRVLGVQVDPNDDVITVNDRTKRVFKLDGSTGASVWEWSFTETPRTFTIDAIGNVVIGGSILDGPVDREVVSKRSSTSGELLWRVVLGGSYVRALTTDADGDVYVASVDSTHGDGSENTILRSLSGEDGHSNWEVALPISPTILERPSALTLDAQGRLLALLTDTVRPSNDEGMKPVPEGSWWVAVSTDAASGATLWRTEVHEPTRNNFGLAAHAVTTAPDGTVYAAGALGTKSGISVYALAVVALDGTTGTERWRHVINGSIGFLSDAQSVKVAPDGSVVAVGRVDTKKAQGPNGYATSLRPSDGRAVWETWLPFSVTDVVGSGLAIGPDGSVHAAGFAYEPLVGHFPSVVKLRSNGTDAGGPTLGITPKPVVREIRN